MKKTILFLLMIIPLLGLGQDTLVKWNFPSITSDTSSGGIPANLSMTISTQGGTNAITFPAGATTYCAAATNWAAGNGTKYWQIKLVSLGYHNLLLSSKQYSSGTGPRDFKAQYSTDFAVSWNDFTANAVTVASNWTTGKLVNVPLPSACDSQDTVYIRWIMASDSAVGSSTVSTTGSSKIDDIYITGQPGILLPATKLFISSINGGMDPYVNTPFNVVINALDSNNNIINVASGTNVSLSLVTGSGILGGTLSGTIPMGASSVTISGVLYDTAESGVSIRVSDQAAMLAPDTSNTFSVLPPIPQGNCTPLFTDSFTDGDFTNNPNWSGDTAKFIVNSSQWLQLNNLGVAGTAYLSTFNNIATSQDTITWDFLTQINYNTSSSNNARFYLMSDSANLKSTLLKGYFVQLGGTNDSVSLCKQNGSGISILIRDKHVCTGTSNNLFRVKVMRKCNNSEWTLYSDSLGGINYISSGSALDGNYVPSALFPYLGVYSKYTSTTGNKYLFDDINVQKCGGCCLPQLISSYNEQFNVNSPLQLNADTIPTATYSWIGPNGFSSNDQNPLVNSNATLSMSGMYYVTATVSDCGSVMDSVNVAVLNQQCDDFSDSVFTPVWTDLAVDTLFKVTSGELQSNGPHSNGNTNPDDIILVRHSPFSSLDSTEWSFLVDLKFAPTADNWVRIFLVSDQQDIKSSINGYYIQIGQTGSDSIKFFRQDGVSSTLLFTGLTSFSGNVKVRIKVFRDCINKNWIIYSDPTGGYNYIAEGKAFSDNTYTTTAYFGVYCHYKTDSRYNEYFFDDFCLAKNCTVGIKESAIENGIAIYPNPADNYLTFEIAPSLVHTDNVVSIYNIQGQLMQQQSLQNEKTEINISSFVDGIYFIRLANPENTSTVRKFIKN